MDHLPKFSIVTVENLKEINQRQRVDIKEFNDYIASMDKSILTYEYIFEEEFRRDAYTMLEDTLMSLGELHPDESIRNISVELNTELSTFLVDENMRRDVFSIISHYYNNQYKEEKNNLTAEQVKYVENSYKSYINSGLNLPDEQYNRVKEINKQLSIYSNKYGQNIAEVKTELFFTLEQLDGLTEEWLSLRFDEETNLYKIKLQYPDYIPIIEFCKVRETRKSMVIAYGSRCIDSNIPIIQDTIKLRKERANIFGFESHTDFELQDDMAKNSQTVNTFLDDLMKKLNPLLQSDLEKLRDLAKELDGLIDITQWDIAYYTRIFKERETNLDQRELAKNFSINSITQGIFSIYQELLALTFTEVTEQFPDALYADTDKVKLFMVSNDTTPEIPMGYFYLDLFPREGKFSHAAMFTFISKSLYNLPVSAIVCNFDPELDVEFDNVVTFFHEFGHLMHNLVSTNTIGSLAGTSCQIDFVETPSQMFERWCYCKEPLQRLVKPEKISNVTDELVEKINAQSKIMEGLNNSRQIIYGILDASIHSADPPEDSWNFYNNMVKDLFGYELDPQTNILANWGHLFGYDGKYYGYQWSLVYAIDLFSFFKDKYLDKELGKKLRYKILAVGGTSNGFEVLRDFMGREPDSNAFVNWLIK